MATGKVKWFNNAKGYGFILPEGGGEDLFVHYSSIQMEGYKTLKAGQDVEFDVLEGPKGLHAVNIRAMGSDARDGEGWQHAAERVGERVGERDADATAAASAIYSDSVSSTS